MVVCGCTAPGADQRMRCDTEMHRFLPYYPLALQEKKAALPLFFSGTTYSPFVPDQLLGLVVRGDRARASSRPCYYIPAPCSQGGELALTGPVLLSAARVTAGGVTRGD